MSKIGKALMWISISIIFNIMTDILVFSHEVAPRHFVTAVIGGIGAGLAMFTLSNRNKSRNAKFSSDL